MDTLHARHPHPHPHDGHSGAAGPRKGGAAHPHPRHHQYLNARSVLMALIVLVSGSMLIRGGMYAGMAIDKEDSSWDELVTEGGEEAGAGMEPSGGGRSGAAADLGPAKEPLFIEQQVAAWLNGNKLAIPGGRKVWGNYTHMAMVEEFKDGRLALAFQASALLEGADDQQIWVMESKDVQGVEWKEPRPITQKMREAGMWSPVLHTDRMGRLLLFYAESGRQCLRAAIRKPAQGRRPAINVPRRYSVGGTIKVAARGIGWIPPRIVYSMKEDGGVPKVVANKLTVLSNGAWLLPFWRQRSWAVCTTPKVANSAGVLLSHDEGHSWAPFGELSLPGDNSWIIEGAVVEIKNGTLHMYLRSTEGFLYRAISTDFGETWGPAWATTIPNPDAKAHVVRVPSGALVMAYNDHVKDFTGISKKADGSASWSKKRDRLLVSISFDGGESWEDVARLDPPPVQRPKSMDGMLFHYPTVQARGDGGVVVAYSRTYTDRDVRMQRQELAADGIYLATIPPELLQRGKQWHGKPWRGHRLTSDPDGCKSADCVKQTHAKEGIE